MNKLSRCLWMAGIVVAGGLNAVLLAILIIIAAILLIAIAILSSITYFIAVIGLAVGKSELSLLMSFDYIKNYGRNPVRSGVPELSATTPPHSEPAASDDTER